MNLLQRDMALQERSDDEISTNLGSVSWDFPTSRTSAGLHSIHPYPAKFIPEIPAALIDGIGLPAGTVILDPFCGGGTTLTEAQARGVRAVGIDLNPIGCLISRVKTTPLPDAFLTTASASVLGARSRKGVEVPAIPNLDHWFSCEAQDGIASLLAAIQIHEHSTVLYDHLRVALSSVLVRASFQDSDTRYAAVQRETSREDVFALFLGACAKIASAKTNLRLSTTVTVLERDVLSLTAPDITSPVGLVITSPPYPNAYEYWLYHKYRMWWLGFDPLSVKQREIGARAHFFKKNAATAQDFETQMSSVMQLLRSVVVPGGAICFVVGRSRIHGQDVDNGEILRTVAHKMGMRSAFSTERTIAANRKSFNLSHARIKTESVLVFRVQ